jgi:hypothetical protein
MIKKNVVMVAVKIFSNKGSAEFKSVLKNLAQTFSISRISSVYKVNRQAQSLAGIRDIRREERIDGLTIVFKAEVLFSPQEALDELSSVEKLLQKEVLKRTISLNLLVYNHNVVMLPGLAVPHPEMHLRPEEIVPAVEIWPDYIHPVLNQPLSQLAQRFENEKWGEFFMQGQALLDF